MLVEVRTFLILNAARSVSIPIQTLLTKNGPAVEEGDETIKELHVSLILQVKLSKRKFLFISICRRNNGT